MLNSRLVLLTRESLAKEARKSARYDYGWKSNSSLSVQAGSFKAISSTDS